jgi:hypothetical protein
MPWTLTVKDDTGEVLLHLEDLPNLSAATNKLVDAEIIDGSNSYPWVRTDNCRVWVLDEMFVDGVAVYKP